MREGEFATAQNAAGVPDRLRAMYNNVASGQRMTPEQAAEYDFWIGPTKQPTAEELEAAGQQRLFEDAGERG